jgi:D-alanine transaminase
MPRIAYVNGAYLPLDEARVSVLDRGFLFADGIYEVTAVLDARLVDNASHFARLERSCGEIGLTLPVTLNEITAIQHDLIARNDLREGVVYLQVTRGAADRDFVAAEGMTPTLVLFTQAKMITQSRAAAKGVAVCTLPDIRWARRDIKSVALLAQTLAKQEAHARGCFEAWMIEDGFVTEGSSSTAWILTADNQLVTRARSHKTLPGCTALAIAALAAETGLVIEERPFSLDEALAAREAFMSSASSFVLPIVSLDGAPVGDGTPGPVATRLRQLYLEFARRTAT